MVFGAPAVDGGAIDPGRLPQSRRAYARNVRSLRKAREIAELHDGLVGRAIPEEGESVEDFVAFQSRARQRIDDMRAELAELESQLKLNANA